MQTVFSEVCGNVKKKKMVLENVEIVDTDRSIEIKTNLGKSDVQ